jgi:hypothetical protein
VLAPALTANAAAIAITAKLFVQLPFISFTPEVSWYPFLTIWLIRRSKAAEVAGFGA